MISLALAVAALLTAAPADGEYLQSHGSGSLVIKAGTFKLETLGANGHTCLVEGKIKGELAHANEGKCKLTFGVKGNVVDVKALHSEDCSEWCGARAWLEGEFTRPAPECTRQAVEETRASFKVLYDQKKWKEALAQLTPLLPKCEDMIGRFEVMWIRNDLAITLHHAGDDAACRKTLEPFGDLLTVKPDEYVTAEPSYDGLYQDIARAAQTNAKLCAPAAPKVKKK